MCGSCFVVTHCLHLVFLVLTLECYKRTISIQCWLMFLRLASLCLHQPWFDYIENNILKSSVKMCLNYMYNLIKVHDWKEGTHMFKFVCFLKYHVKRLILIKHCSNERLVAHRLQELPASFAIYRNSFMNNKLKIAGIVTICKKKHWIERAMLLQWQVAAVGHSWNINSNRFHFSAKSTYQSTIMGNR